MRRGLEPTLTGAILARVEARRPDLRFPLPDGFVQRLTGARIERLERRGKFIIAPLDRGESLVMHLGMTGRFEIGGASPATSPDRPVRAAPADPKHAHVVFETQAGARVTFFDARRFGFMDLIESHELPRHPWFALMGPEPLGEAFDEAHLARVFADRRQGAKTLLLDQRTVAGLGNIYVCEALNRARVSPTRPAGTISRAARARIVAAVRSVLEAAIVAGGSTLRDYAGADGALGYFQHRFAAYGRAGQACRRQGCQGVIARIVQSGRSTFFCPRCQR